MTALVFFVAFAAGLRILLTIVGLSAFEVVNSLDNAVVNSNILTKIVNPKARKFFVTWGMLVSVGVVRGLLPFVIYYIPNAHLGFHAAVLGFWSGDPRVVAAVNSAAPYLSMAGGMFLALLWLHWLMVEDKDACAFKYEDIFSNTAGAWFFAVAGISMVAVLWHAMQIADPWRGMKTMLAAAIGVAVFFFADGFKEHAEFVEKRLLDENHPENAGMSDWSKVFYLEVLDATFSTDGVVGAFAFTMVVPLILVGNGIGAYVVRRLTLSNADKLCSYKLLKNGAMWAIGFLGATMILEGFGKEIPFWVSPVITFACIGVFFWLSVRANRKAAVAA